MPIPDDTLFNTIREHTRWVFTTDTEPIATLREITKSLLITTCVIAILFSISGIWPPLLAIESGSMEPSLDRGDLIYVVEEHRYTNTTLSHANTGVVTHQTASSTNYRTFGDYGDVITYTPNGNADRVQIVHRAHFWVNDSENWYDKANPEYLNGNSCAAIQNCPAPHAGFITKGDMNPYYDQIVNISEPVRPRWVSGTVELHVPYLGYIRLALS